MDIGNIIDAAFSNAFGPQAIVFALAAIGLNIHFGYTGLLNFGQAGFMAVGAYGLAVAMVRLDLPLVVGVAIGLIASLLLALVLGVPTLRLRADYLAIVTIAAAEILRLVFGAVETKEVFGGSNGLNGFTETWNNLNPYTGGLDIGIASWGRNDLWAMTVGWITVALCCLLVWALMRSPWGRVLRSIREDEDAVRSLGKNVFLYKMQALMLGGVIGGLGGIFYALKQASVVPSDYSTNLTFFAYTALLIGGAARVLGPHPHGPRPHAADDLPTPGDLRRPKGDRARCPLTSPVPARHSAACPTTRACPSPTRSSRAATSRARSAASRRSTSSTSRSSAASSPPSSGRTARARPRCSTC